MNLWKSHRKRVGPGGIKCTCCNPYNCHPRKSKPMERKMIRRKMKRELKNEIEG